MYTSKLREMDFNFNSYLSKMVHEHLGWLLYTQIYVLFFR